jgi:hypothetical protein
VFVQVPANPPNLISFVRRVVRRKGLFFVNSLVLPGDTMRTSVVDSSIQTVHDHSGSVLSDLQLNSSHPNEDEVAQRLDWAKTMRLEFFLVDVLIGSKLLRAAAETKGRSQMVVQLPNDLNTSSCFGLYNRSLPYMLAHWANQVAESGANAIACSPLYLRILRKQKRFDGMPIIVRGTCSAERSQEHRTCMTPQQAFNVGANHVIMQHD